METLNPGEVQSTVTEVSQTISQLPQQYENHPLYSVLYKLSIDELKERCKKNYIIGFSRLKKAEIVNLITKNFINKFNDNCDQLSSLKLDELKALCKSNNLSGYSSLKKDELISFITVSNIIKVIETPEEKNEEISIPFNLSDDDKSLNEIRLNELKKKTQKNKKSEENDISSISNIPIMTTENILEKILNEKKLLEEKEKLIYEQLEKEKEEKERQEKERKEKERQEKERHEKEQQEKERQERERQEASSIDSDSKNKKKKIPKAVRTHVWNLYIGAHINEHRCLCCKKALIKITDFETGHVVSESEGGTMEISNLRPICSVCNHSMGTMNMIEYVKKYGYYI